MAHNHPDFLVSFTDGLIGNAFGQYLTNIPISYEPKNLEYHPLKTDDLSNVRFRMYQTNGSMPEFSVASIKIFMSIIFRNKQDDQMDNGDNIQPDHDTSPPSALVNWKLFLMMMTMLN